MFPKFGGGVGEENKKEEEVNIIYPETQSRS
jgi:hypothetical protein